MKLQRIEQTKFMNFHKIFNPKMLRDREEREVEKLRDNTGEREMSLE
jgi:hypothetical protein